MVNITCKQLFDDNNSVRKRIYWYCKLNEDNITMNRIIVVEEEEFLLSYLPFVVELDEISEKKGAKLRVLVISVIVCE